MAVSDVLIDTNFYCDAMRGVPKAVAVLRESDQILVSPIVVGELLSGFKSGKSENANRNQLRKFLAQERVRVLQVTTETAEFYALIHEQLKRKAKPVPTNDLWIAASAMENGTRLATTDAHFRHIDGILLT
jgi:tRNA(fMet)-specific endonuclease VapC